MKQNTNRLDRGLRIAAGVALLVMAALDMVGWLGMVGGLALIASGLIGWCAVYRTFGLSTCPVEPKK